MTFKKERTNRLTHCSMRNNNRQLDILIGSERLFANLEHKTVPICLA